MQDEWQDVQCDLQRVIVKFSSCSLLTITSLCTACHRKQTSVSLLQDAVCKGSLHLDNRQEESVDFTWDSCDSFRLLLPRLSRGGAI